MHSKRSVTKLEEALRESTPPRTAVPTHFRQQLRRDLQAGAIADPPPPQFRRWVVASMALLVVAILAFWLSTPKTTVEPALEINTPRPVPTVTPLSVLLNQTQAIQAALTFATNKTNNKPIGGWLVNTDLEAITATASLESYDISLNRLGSFAIAEFEGSNIIFPENEPDQVWLVHLQGRWQPFGETVDMIEPSRYVAVLLDPLTGQVVGAGSATVPFVVEPITLSLNDYPPQERPYFVEQGGDFWFVNLGSQLLAFDPRSPYHPNLPPSEGRPARCLYTWVEANGHFTDPCSGDEWELDGTINLAESTELWSNRNLDQYRTELAEKGIIIHLDEIIFGGKTVLEITPHPLPESTFDSRTVLETTPTPSIGTFEQPQTDFKAVIEQTTALSKQRQTLLSGQSGWLYTAVHEYQPLYNQGEGASFLDTFSTENMVSETWYHVLDNGSVDQAIYRYTNADELVVLLTVFIDGFSVDFFGDTIYQTPQRLRSMPNEAAWVAELLGEMQAYTFNEATVSAYIEPVGNDSHYLLKTINVYDIPIPAEVNSLGQTINGEEATYIIDVDTGQLLSRENITIVDSGEQLVSFSRTFQAEDWLATLPDEIALYLAQAQARLASRNLTWVAPTPTPDFSPALAQTRDTKYGITVTVLGANNMQGEVAVMMMTQVDSSWEVVDTFPIFQNFLSLPFLSGQRPFTLTHSSGEAMELDEATGDWWESSTHYFAGKWGERETLRLETAVDLSALHRVITLPISLNNAEVGQSWSLEWQLPLGPTQLQVSEVHWLTETTEGQAQVQLQVVDNSSTDLDVYCLQIAVTDPWQQQCAIFEGENTYTLTVPPNKPIVLHLRASLLVNGFVIAWQP